jgi:DNA replication protein DnaC
MSQVTGHFENEQRNHFVTIRLIEIGISGRSERLTGAALDRLTHRCHILETKGESYRLQDAKRRRRASA